MGRGIVQVLAQCGVRTLVFDSKPGAALAAKDAIGKSLAGLVQKGRVPQADADRTLARIEIADSLAALKPCHRSRGTSLLGQSRNFKGWSVVADT